MTALVEPDVRELPDDPEPQFPDDPGGASFDVEPGDGYRCTICGDAVPPTPSGRAPRLMLCEEHRAARDGKSTKTATSTRKPTHERIAQGMSAFHTMLGFVVGSVYMVDRNDVWLKDRDVWQEAAPELGEAWAKVTDVNPKVRKRVESFLDSVGYLTLAAAYAKPVALTVQNHVQSQAAAVPAQAAPQAQQFYPGS